MNLLNNKPTLQVTPTEVAILRDFKNVTENLYNPEAITLLLEDITNEVTNSTHFNIHYVEDGKSYFVVSVHSDEFGLVNLGVFSTKEKAKESLINYETNNSSEIYNCWNDFFKAYCAKSTFILDFEISEEYLDYI